MAGRAASLKAAALANQPDAVFADRSEAASAPREVRPQPGPQELILQTPADIGIIGGSVFGGKTWSLVIEPLRNVDVPGFTFVCFRREIPEITQPGGLWDESLKWYSGCGGVPREHRHEWVFRTARSAEAPNGGIAVGKFAGLQHESDKEKWKGGAICLLEFDQLEMFSEETFFYMLSRNRSTCGVQPYVRASVNPHPDSFLVDFLAWWIGDDGYALPERSGAIRWFVRIHDTVQWASTTCYVTEYHLYDDKKAEAIKELSARFGHEGQFAKSVTFVLARLQDNKIGMELDPDYEANVRALPMVERERLLGGDRGGNWKVRATAGKVFNRAWFRALPALPTDVVHWVRYWDKAGTEGSGKYTAGALVGRRSNGRFLIANVTRGQWSAANREIVIKQTAEIDRKIYRTVDIWVEQEPGSGGKESAENTVINLAGFVIRAERVTGSKLARAGPLSAQAEVHNVDLLAGAWNEDFLSEAQNFDGVHGFTDQIDAASGAFNKLVLAPPMQKVQLAGFGG